jgi:Domain of unknown function (DUF4150)
MPKPIAIAKGIAFAFPDVCKTPAPPAPNPVPLPYPNIAQLDQAKPIADQLVVGSSQDKVLLLDAVVNVSTGDEAGSAGGVKSGGIKGTCTLKGASKTVVYGPSKKGIVRFLDNTEQNGNNANGMVLSAFPTVLVGD